jgi:cytochrome c biogenesis protein CcmG, thiol:disulfide interchange protein DsbE
MQTMGKIQIWVLGMLLLGAALSGGCRDSGPSGALLQTGQPAPDFLLEDLQGRPWRLSEQRGKVVFLNFWASWCPPCREEMPDMEALHQEMALMGRPFQMLAVLSNDDPANGALLAERLALTFPILVDREAHVAQSYGLTGVPETFIIDGDGILQERFIGARPWNSPEAKNMLARYMR